MGSHTTIVQPCLVDIFTTIPVHLPIGLPTLRLPNHLSTYSSACLPLRLPTPLPAYIKMGPFAHMTLTTYFKKNENHSPNM